jgi:hypothetical protein
MKMMILFRRSQRQRISPSPEPQLIANTNQPSPLDHPHYPQSFNKLSQLPSTPLLSTDNSNSLSAQSKMTNNLLQTPNSVDQQKLHLFDSVNK